MGIKETSVLGNSGKINTEGEHLQQSIWIQRLDTNPQSNKRKKKSYLEVRQVEINQISIPTLTSTLKENHIERMVSQVNYKKESQLNGTKTSKSIKERKKNWWRMSYLLFTLLLIVSLLRNIDTIFFTSSINLYINSRCWKTKKHNDTQ